MSLLKRRKARVAAITAVLVAPIALFAALAQAGIISNGDLVVYQAGTGSAALSGTSTAGFVDEYTPAGTLVQQIPMPTAASGSNLPLTTSGSAASEGEITVSPNGQYVAIPGYDAAPGVASIASTTATADPREVGILTVSTGALNTSTTLGTTAFSGNNPRSAVTTDGNSIWAGGAGGTEATQGGVWYTTLGSSTSTSLVFGNQRQVDVYNGQLYISSASATAPAVIGISAVGSGLPTTGPQTTTVITGVDSSASGTPYAYVMESLGGTNNPDTIYVADTTVGIQKYSLVGSTWSETGSIALPNVTGIAAADVDGTVDIYATIPGAIYSYVDSTGYDGTITGSATSIASAPTNTAFRGIGIIPSVPEPASVGLLAFGAMGLAARRRAGR
jgi:hypothetical protein